MDIDRERLRQDLMRDEGVRLKAYRDSLGFWTIGVGHLLPSTASGSEEVTIQEAMEILEADMDKAIALARRIFGELGDMAEPRARALVNLAFNLGNKLREFKRFKAAVVGRDWDLAAAELVDSDWWGQVGERAVRIRDAIKDGV